jgi:phosphopentomutase
MKSFHRVLILVLDSLGAGALPDAHLFGDEGSHTIRSISSSPLFSVPNLLKMGLGNIPGLEFLPSRTSPTASFGRMAERSMGKDTTIGHWELAGIVSPEPLPTYPKGFPREILDPFEKIVGKKVLCNLPYSGTAVIEDYWEEHRKTGSPIVYTSADSVFQIAAHEEIIPLDTLYEYCLAARKLLQGKDAVGRVIARPFIGEKGNFVRTANRRDFSLEPPFPTLPDQVKAADLDVVFVGKVGDIFASRGMTKLVKTKGNEDGMEKILNLAKEPFHGLLFANLVDFDSQYGHRNDVDGYAAALSRFDSFLPSLLSEIGSEDVLFITADHGCDPATPSTDHSGSLFLC